MLSVYTPTGSTFYHAIFTPFFLVMDFSSVRFVFANILFSSSIENLMSLNLFYLTSNVLPENLVMMTSINNAQFYWIASFIPIENTYMLWLSTDLLSLLIYTLSCTENRDQLSKNTSIFSIEQSLMQDCYVNESIAQKDST